MAKLTKTQKKRLVNEIESKAKKLYMYGGTTYVTSGTYIVDTKDMNAIEKLCKKFRQRLG
jgi:hypothetical protein